MPASVIRFGFCLFLFRHSSLFTVSFLFAALFYRSWFVYGLVFCRVRFVLAGVICLRFTSIVFALVVGIWIVFCVFLCFSFGYHSWLPFGFCLLVVFVFVFAILVSLLLTYRIEAHAPIHFELAFCRDTAKDKLENHSVLVDSLLDIWSCLEVGRK